MADEGMVAVPLQVKLHAVNSWDAGEQWETSAMR